MISRYLWAARRGIDDAVARQCRIHCCDCCCHLRPFATTTHAARFHKIERKPAFPSHARLRTTRAHAITRLLAPLPVIANGGGFLQPCSLSSLAFRLIHCIYQGGGWLGRSLLYMLETCAIEQSRFKDRNSKAKKESSVGPRTSTRLEAAVSKGKLEIFVDCPVTLACI